MFKNLRDKLKGVSKKLEEEVEKSLEDQLEAELQAAVRKEQERKAAAAQPAAPAPPTHVPPAPPATAQAPVPAAPPAPTPPAPPKPAPAAPAPPPSPRPEPAQVPEPKPAAPAPPERQPPPAPVSPEPTAPQAPAPAAPTPHVPLPPESIARSSQAQEPPAPSPSPAPTPAPLPVAAPAASAVPQAPATAKPERRPQQQLAGRKILTEAEIEARLARELSEAVAVQKEVEKVVEEVAPAATRFTINEQVLEEILWELELGLLESDVALPVIEAIKANVKEQLLTLAVGGKRPEEIVEKVLRTAIKRVLQVNPLDFDRFVRERLAAGKRPVVVMFVGVNGTGKTTSIGRIAWRLKQQGIGCVMAAGDTFRAGAIEQLALHGERLGVTVIKHKAGADPAAVAFDAIEHAKARGKEVVLLDTAGRMQNNSNLMDEMDKIRRVASPDLCVFVGDSLAGNDAVEQARRFDEVVDVGGVILTKVDVDAKGGAALSVAYTINKPLLFVGVGQNYPDLKPFDAEWLVDRLFGGEADEQPVGTPAA